jgi:hypothetical protein
MSMIESTEKVIDDGQRIFELVKTDLCELKRDASGWDILYKHSGDGRYWELIYSQSYKHGGSAPRLRNITPKEVPKNMASQLNKWLVIRILLLSYLIYVGWGGASEVGITWPAAVLVPIVFGVFGFLWLQMRKDDERRAWSDAFSFTTPFFPLARHPMQGFGFFSLMAFVLGAVSGGADIFSRHRVEPEDCMYLLIGLFSFIVVRIYTSERREHHLSSDL